MKIGNIMNSFHCIEASHRLTVETGRTVESVQEEPGLSEQPGEELAVSRLLRTQDRVRTDCECDYEESQHGQEDHQLANLRAHTNALIFASFGLNTSKPFKLSFNKTRRCRSDNALAKVQVQL